MKYHSFLQETSDLMKPLLMIKFQRLIVIEVVLFPLIWNVKYSLISYSCLVSTLTLNS